MTDHRTHLTHLASGLAALRLTLEHDDAGVALDLARILEAYACDALTETPAPLEQTGELYSPVQPDEVINLLNTACTTLDELRALLETIAGQLDQSINAHHLANMGAHVAYDAAEAISCFTGYAKECGIQPGKPEPLPDVVPPWLIDPAAKGGLQP